MFDVRVGSRKDTYTDTDYTTNLSLPPLGKLEWDPDYNAFFRLLKNTGAATIAASLVAVALGTDKTDFKCALAAATDAVIGFAGIRVVGATDVAQNEYGWFQVTGNGSFLHSGGQASAANEAIVTSASVAGKVEGGAPTVNTVASLIATIGLCEATATVLDTVVKARLMNSVFAP